MINIKNTRFYSTSAPSAGKGSIVTTNESIPSMIAKEFTTITFKQIASLCKNMKHF